MTEAWKAMVRAKLRDSGHSESWLAREVGARRRMTIKPDSINKMLRTQNSSIFVEDVCEILGLPPPMIEPPDDRTARIIELAMAAPEEIKDAVLVLLEGPRRVK